MRGKIGWLLIRIDTSEVTTRLVFLFQILWAASAFGYSLTIGTKLNTVYVYTFWIFLAPALLLSFIRLIASNRYGILKLYLRKGSGILEDSRTGFRNVSLRAASVEIMLRHLACAGDPARDNLRRAGCEMGISFYEGLHAQLQKESSGPGGLSVGTMLDHWMQYDSSSGMGLFEYCDFQGTPKLRLQIRVRNAFTCLGDDNRLCEFLAGYLEGFASKLFKCDVRVTDKTCARASDQDICTFKLSQPLGNP